MSPEAALTRAIDADAENPWDALSVLADWYDDNGQPLMAWAYRWFVHERKRPDGEPGYVWLWWSTPIAGLECCVPFSGSGAWFEGHDSESDAYAAAAAELIKPEYTHLHQPARSSQ